MRIRHEHLKTRGWSDAEIAHAHRVIDHAEAHKHPAYAFLEVAVFWGLLFLMAAGMVAIDLVIVPLLVAFPTPPLLLIIVILGTCLGALFAVLVPDIEWLKRHHHGLAFAVLGTLAVLNIWFLTSRLNAIEESIPFGVTHQPLLLGIVFALAVLAPYAWHLRRGKR